MEHFKPPEHLDFSGNVSENWKRWKQRFDLFMAASDSDEKDSKKQVAILLHTIGDEGIEIFNTFVFGENGESNFEIVVKAFDDYCNPRKRTIMERYTFWEKVQREGETIDQYVTALKNHAKNCEFDGDQKDKMIRDRLIFGVREQRLKERMLRDSADPTLERVIELCRAAEASAQQLKELHEPAPSVHAFSRKPYKQNKSAQVQAGASKPQNEQFQCGRCGKTHGPRQCPAYTHVCTKCGRRGHFTVLCRTMNPGPQYKKGKPRRTPKHAHSIEEHSHSAEENWENLFIGELTIGHIEEAWYADLKINNNKHPVQFKLDTGAEANVLPQKQYEKLSHKPRLEKTNTVLSVYGGQKLKPSGKVSTQMRGKTVELYVVDVNSPAILGLRTCQDLQLIERVDSVEKKNSKTEEKPLTKEILVSEFSDVFTGLGKFEGEYKIEIDKSVTPVVHPPRKVPFSLQGKLKETLEDLEKDGVIAAVDEPTEWVNSLVIVEKKDGSMRLCLDPKDLNAAIKREHYKIPTAEDIAAELHGKKVFSILDERQGYWQVQLDHESSMLCTFNTPFGRYRFRRLPFGITCSSEVFQKKNHQIFGDIQGAHMIVDDMIIAAETTEEHDKIARKVMQRAREQNVKFNPSKIQFKVDTVKYMGNVITPEGMKADDKKIQAIVDMPNPTDKQSLQRLLGMVNYLSKFIPNVAEKTAPLRGLLKKESEWVWDANQDKALEDVKDALTKSPVLQFFDQSQQVTIQADASQSGLGACLMQNNNPVAYASRSLTSAEQNYAQIEKELLAIVFACDKFHQYVYGRLVEVQSDHKPLTWIIKKPLAKASPRLQRMLLKLQSYEINITHVPGKEMHIADALSRAYLTDYEPDSEFEEEMEVRVHAFVKTLSVSEQKLAELKKNTEQDLELQDLLTTVKTGWPERKSETKTTVRQFWSIRDEIHTAEGLLFSGERLIIPKNMRREMLDTVHESHLGIEKCKARARSTIYWPGMSSEIEDFVSKCSTCNRFKNRQQKEPLIPHELPERPWQKLGIDLFEYGSKNYLVVVDYYSKYPEICALENKTARNVILHLKSILARHGIPETIMSDNMPFQSREFKEFARQWNIDLLTSSPTYAQSNGLSERMVQTVKNLLRKAQEENSDPYISLLEYRNTPLSGMSYSPAQLLMSRSLRSKIPVSKTLLMPEVAQKASEQLKMRQERQKKEYDSRARELPVLESGDVVRIREQNTWEPAVVTQHHTTPRSYMVINTRGREYRRNRKHLLKTAENPPVITGPEIDDDDTLQKEVLPREVPPRDARSTSPARMSQNITCNSPTNTSVKIPTNTSVKMTASGRIVREPLRFKDYVK